MSGRGKRAKEIVEEETIKNTGARGINTKWEPWNQTRISRHVEVCLTFVVLRWTLANTKVAQSDIASL
jgi:hypothetical protein